MKRYVKIWINSEEVDVDAETLRLALDIAVETDEPGKVRGAYSKRAVSLPGTSINRAIFEDIQEGTTVLVSSNQLLPARVEANGIPILQGQAQLAESVLHGQRGQVRQYKTALYGNNADWFLQIKNKRIRDLGYSTLTLDFATIESSAANATWEDEVTYGLVRWKDWEQGTAVTHLEHSVCLFLRWILYKGFADIGYQITGDFLDTDLFERLVIPVPIRPYEEEYADDVVNVRATNSSTEDFAQGAGPTDFPIDFPDDSTFPNFDAGGNFNTTTFEYIVPSDGFYKFTYQFNITAYSDFNDMRFVIKKNGSDWITAPAQPGAPFYAETLWQELVAGDVIRAFFRLELSGVQTATISGATFYTDFESRGVNEGQTLDLQYQIPPEWTVKDVLLDLQRMFGLVIDTDPAAGVILIEPRDKYTLRSRYPGLSEVENEGYYYSSSAINISERLDVSKDSQLRLITDLTRFYVQDYAIDDETVTSFQESERFRLYGARYDFGANRFQAGETVMNTDFFVKTYAAFDPAITSTASSATVYMPIVIDGDYRLSTAAAALPDEFGPHVLYHAGRRGGLDGKVNIYNTGTSATSAYDHPYLFMFNPLDSDGYDPSIAFSNETTDSSIEIPGLMQRFHLRHLARLEGGRRFEHYVKLDVVDVAELSFRYKRYIDAGLHLLERVDGYNPLTDRSTKLIMLKDEGPTSTQANKIAQASLPTNDSVATGSGGTGIVGGGGTGGGDANRQWFRQWFFNHTSATMNITVNSGLLPGNEAQIEIVDSDNGQVISPQFYSISGSVITLTFTPTGEDYYVRFPYP